VTKKLVAEDEDDHKLYNESFIDVEVYSGGILRAGQKLMLSILIQNDDLFEIPTDRFVPILYTFRAGNFTDEGVSLKL
jgi:hypothetical protein